MAPRNPSNPGVRLNFDKSWPMMHLTAERLAEIQLDYHIFTHVVCGLASKEVLRSANMEVWWVSCKENVMVVYETQLKCGPRIPFSASSATL